MNTITAHLLPAAPASKPSKPDFSSSLLAALGHIYLEAGLPLAAAFEAALADLESFGSTSSLCQT